VRYGERTKKKKRELKKKIKKKRQIAPILLRHREGFRTKEGKK